MHWDQAVPLTFFSALHSRNILVFNFYFKHVEEMLLKISKYDCDSRIVRVFSTSQNIRDITNIPISMSLAFLLCKCKQRTCHSSTSVFELQQNIFNFYQKWTYDFDLQSSQRVTNLLLVEGRWNEKQMSRAGILEGKRWSVRHVQQGVWFTREFSWKWTFDESSTDISFRMRRIYTRTVTIFPLHCTYL